MKIKSITFGISLIICALLVSCEAHKTTIPDINVTAHGTSEGIYLHIGNIPNDTLYLSVSLHNITTNDMLLTGTVFQDNELEQLRNSGSVLCPFVKNGYEYEITVTALGILTDEGLKTINSTVTTAIANGGIYMTNNPMLVWNNDNIIAFSERPVFTDEETNSQNFELRYGLVFRTDETNNRAASNSRYTFDNSRNFDAIAEMIGNIGLNGYRPMHVEAELYVEHENIEWAKVFAISDDYLVSPERIANIQAPLNVSLAK